MELSHGMQKAVLSNQDQLDAIDREIQEIITDLRTEGSYLRNIYSTKSPKKDALVHWAELLEKKHDLGAYSEPINTISSYIKTELKKLGLNEAIPYVHEVLQFKYKDSKYNSADETEGEGQPRLDSSIETICDYRKENQLAIEDVKADIEILKQFEKKLEETNFISKIDLEEYKQFLLANKMSRQRLQDVLDGREKVMYSTQHIYLSNFVLANKEYIFANYVKHIKDYADFTSKQALKILRGRISRILPLYEPKNRIEAINSGFYGMPCPDCGNWRVDIVTIIDENTRKPEDRMYCYAKGHKNKIKSLKLKSE